jgi:hypothetical protein
MTLRMRIGVLVTTLAWIATASAALAQTIDVVTSDPREQEEQALARKPYRLSVAYAHRFEANLDKNGRFSTDTTRIEFASQTELAKSLSWDNMVAYEFNYYDFTNTQSSNQTGTERIGGDPFQDVHQLTYIPVLRWKIDPNWSIFGGPALQVSAESGADFGDGVTGGALFGFLWRRDANLSVGGAVAAISRIEDTVGLAPIPLVNWRFAEGWALRSGVPDFGARRGFGLELGWGMDEWEIAAGAQFQRRRFRLDDDDSGLTGSSKGVGQETSAPVYVKFTYRMSKDASIDLFGGVSLAGELKVEDRNGHDNQLPPGYDNKQQFDPAPIVGTRVNFLF